MPRSLTPRELEIARELARGRRLKESAYDLGITENTLKVYSCRLYRALDVNSRVGLIRWLHVHDSAFPHFRTIAQQLNLTSEQILEILQILLERRMDTLPIQSEPVF